jgi:hypothetical protein
MRRILFFLLLGTGILTVIAGIAESGQWHGNPPVFHILTASIFVILCITHIVLNRKAVMRYLRGK